MLFLDVMFLGSICLMCFSAAWQLGGIKVIELSCGIYFGGLIVWLVLFPLCRTPEAKTNWESTLNVNFARILKAACGFICIIVALKNYEKNVASHKWLSLFDPALRLMRVVVCSYAIWPIASLYSYYTALFQVNDSLAYYLKKVLEYGHYKLLGPHPKWTALVLSLSLLWDLSLPKFLFEALPAGVVAIGSMLEKIILALTILVPALGVIIVLSNSLSKRVWIYGQRLLAILSRVLLNLSRKLKDHWAIILVDISFPRLWCHYFNYHASLGRGDWLNTVLQSSLIFLIGYLLFYRVYDTGLPAFNTGLAIYGKLKSIKIPPRRLFGVDFFHIG